MLITLENGLTVNLLVPEKVFYRIVSNDGNFKDFIYKDDAFTYFENLCDFFGEFRLYKIIQSLDDFGKVISTSLEEL